MTTTLLTPAQAGDDLGGISAETLKGWRRRGVGPRYIKVGRLVRYAPADLAAWKQSQSVDPARRTA